MILQVLVVLLGCCTIATPVLAAGSEDLPIFDAHIHYNRDVWSLYSVDEALGILDQAGVYRAFVSSTPLLPGDVARDPVPRAVADLGARRGLVLHAHADGDAVARAIAYENAERVLAAAYAVGTTP